MIQSRRPTRPVHLTPKAGTFRKLRGTRKHFVFQYNGNFLAQVTGSVMWQVALRALIAIFGSVTNGCSWH
jgi:hypothetical protein